MLHEILSVLLDVWAETGFILIALAIAVVVSLLAIRIGDWLADRRERAALMRREELRNTANREARRQATKNDAAWAGKYGNTR